MYFRNYFFSSLVGLTSIGSTLSFIANLDNSNSNQQGFSPSSSLSNSSNKKEKQKKVFKFVGTVLVVTVILILGMKFLSSINFSTGGQKSAPEVKGATATEEINREFIFPLKDANGDEIGSIKYMVEKAELRDEIIVKGQKATAVSGRTFIIFTIKVSNDFKQPIQINTRDYIRLSVNGNQTELLAPDIHNDPVEVQAISTKYTRFGFPINTTDTNLKVLVGEINSDKQEIELTLQ
jgi:hypothetical protein